MKPLINILFLGGAKRVSLAEHFINTADRLGFQASIFSYELEEKVPIASVGKVIIGKRWTDTGVIDDLKSCIHRHSINVVLPFVDPAIGICAELAQSCSGVFIPVSDSELCQTMFDKVLSSAWFDQHGIQQPKHFLSADGIEYPVILKPRTGSASKGLIVCKNKEDLPDVDFSCYLCSSYIANRTEYSVDCYVNREGIATSIVPRIRQETSGGEVVRSATVRDEKIIDVSRKILSVGGFRGPLTIQFIRDNQTGDLLVMEVNPRFGGGVVTSICAGSRVVEMVLREAQGDHVEVIADWVDNILITRYFKEVVFPCK